jgi:alpha-galactosidase
LGIEYFVLDAGWYAGCGPGGEFSRGVGNWLRIDEKKFPSGIESLAEYVRSKGMKFGMWFEVERAHRESDIVREHPDWFIDIGEEYLHLNLAKKEAQDGIIEIISQWVRRLDLKWIRYDYNIGSKPFWEHIDKTGKIQFKYLQGLYRVLDELMKRHPDLLIECCASGGRRIDLGTLKRAHTIWISDHTEDPHICRFMQSGGNRFLPANLLNSAVPNYLGSKEKKRTIDFLSRMVGAFSLDGDVASWSEEQSLDVKNLIKIYKSIRHLLVQDFHPLTPQPSNPDEGEVISFVSEEKGECVIFAFRMPNEPMKRSVKLRGILPNMDYYVRDLLNSGKPINLVKGDTLMREGLELDLTPDCALYYLSIKGGDF